MSFTTNFVFILMNIFICLAAFMVFIICTGLIIGVILEVFREIHW